MFWIHVNFITFFRYSLINNISDSVIFYLFRFLIFMSDIIKYRFGVFIVNNFRYRLRMVINCHAPYRRE